jgi:hypothetical protein
VDTGVSELPQLRDLVRQFVDERDGDQFHTPKDLSSALSVEAATWASRSAATPKSRRSSKWS